MENGEKTALVGINGAGKTTLIRILTGELSPEEGMVSISRGTTFGCLSQHPVMNGHKTIMQELMDVKAYIGELEEQIRECEREMAHLSGEALDDMMQKYTALTSRFEAENGYAARSELMGILNGLGFRDDEYEKYTDTLSGGERTRVALGRLLLQKPDLLLLDEPTNHLDINALRWLESYLQSYKGAVLIVSHDRYFLDRVAGRVLELDGGILTSFPGNYSSYAEKKKALRQSQMRAYMNQQAEIKHQQEVIDKLKSFNREKSVKRAESRQKMLDKIETLDKPTEIRDDMKLSFSPSRLSGKDVLDAESLSKAFGSQVLFSDLSFSLKRGEHVAVIGGNGTGKSTLLKILNGVEEADGGTFKTGANVEIGYYDQEHQVLHMEKTLYDEISDEHPHMTATEIRNKLAAFLFTGDDVFKTVSNLSGGERGRLSLLKLMLSEANVLILDEPTNHLDITSREILEDALSMYEGTVLAVSHDRYFINRIAHRILELENGTFTGYLGNYDEYAEKKFALGLGNPDGIAPQTATLGFSKPDKAPAEAVSSSGGDTGKLSWQAEKEKQAALRKKENELKKTEARIEELETLIADLEEKMALPENCTNSAKLGELSSASDSAKEELEALYEKWEKLSS